MNKESAKSDVLVIRSWPKMIFLWPTALTALIAGFVMWSSPDWGIICGQTFIIVCGLNMAVLTFDFPRSTSLTIFITLVTLLLGVVLLNQKYGIIAPLQTWLNSLDISASADFYFCIFGIMFLLYIGMAIVTRFDYWEVTNNELIHHTGLLGDVERFSTAGLKLNTEINDVFEFILAGAGRIIMNVPGNPRPFVLDNVLRIKTVLKRSNELLSRRVVQVTTAGATESSRKETEQRQANAEYE